MKQLTNLEKRVRRRIAKASKRGRYLVTRRGRRDRPGRKKGSAKKKLLEGIQQPEGYSLPAALKTTKMHIPKMSKK